MPVETEQHLVSIFQLLNKCRNPLAKITALILYPNEKYIYILRERLFAIVSVHDDVGLHIISNGHRNALRIRLLRRRPICIPTAKYSLVYILRCHSNTGQVALLKYRSHWSKLLTDLVFIQNAANDLAVAYVGGNQLIAFRTSHLFIHIARIRVQDQLIAVDEMHVGPYVKYIVDKIGTNEAAPACHQRPFRFVHRCFELQSAYYRTHDYWNRSLACFMHFFCNSCCFIMASSLVTITMINTWTGGYYKDITNKYARWIPFLQPETRRGNSKKYFKSLNNLENNNKFQGQVEKCDRNPVTYCAILQLRSTG